MATNIIETEDYRRMVKMYETFGKPKVLLESFIDNDYPVPFTVKDEKGETKTEYIYPIKMVYYKYFVILVQSLQLDKNDSGDFATISMHYLDYLFYLAEKGQPQHLLMAQELISLCVHRESIFDTDMKGTPSIEVQRDDKNKRSRLRIGDNYINADEFDDLVKIIFKQNGVEVRPDEIHPDIWKRMKEVDELRAKQNHTTSCGIGDQMNIAIMQGIPKEQVLDMTILTFKRLLKRIDIVMHYNLMTLLSPNLDKKSRNNIKHYMTDVEADKYKHIGIDLDEFKEKIK